MKDYFDFIKRFYLFNTEKIKYVGKKNKKHKCILCAIRDKNKNIENLEIYRNDLFIITLNLYPFNPGHCMIFPLRHIKRIEDYTYEEVLSLHELTKKLVKVIKKEFNPTGFNIGYNIGEWSGASIQHIHQHIVPRYPNEVGFIDILGNARPFVMDPKIIQKKIQQHFKAE